MNEYDTTDASKHDGVEDCVLCSTGRYSNDANGAESCAECAEGKKSGAGASSCSSCPAVSDDDNDDYMCIGPLLIAHHLPLLPHLTQII